MNKQQDFTDPDWPNDLPKQSIPIDPATDLRSGSTLHERQRKLFSGYSKHRMKMFKAYHDANPEIYKMFEASALALHASGIASNAKKIFEDLRFDKRLTKAEEEFKVSNTFTGMYARLAIRNHPKLEGFFVLKTPKT